MAVEKKSIIQNFWNLFTSMSFGIILILILTVMSLYGATVLDHRSAMEKVYSSWWFIGTLTITAANILVCSINRLPKILKKTTVLKKDVDIKWLKALDNKATLDILLDSNTAQYLMTQLKKQNYRVGVTAGEEKSFLISADKGRFGYWGSIVTHFSLVLILAAFFYGTVGMQEDYKTGFPGSIIELPMHGFKIRIDDFEIAYRDNPQRSIEQYYSTLTVIEDGLEIKTDTIFVNKPFRYNGVNLYQSTYGWGVDVEFTDRESAEKIKKLLLPGEIGFYPELNIYVKVLQFYPDFTMTGDGVPYSRSAYPANPYVVFQMLNRDGGIIGNPYYIEPTGEALYLMDGHIMEFTGFKNYAGFQIIKQPGRYLALIASIMLIVGLFISFYLYPRRIWIYADDNKDKESVFIFGTSHRNKVGFGLEFERLVEILEGDRRKK